MKTLLSLKYQIMLLIGVLVVIVFAFVRYDLSGEYIKQGDRHYDGGEYAYAVLNYEQAVKYGDTNPDAYFKLARGEIADGNPLRAASAYTKAIELGYAPTALAYIGLGWTQYSLAQYDDAVRTFDTAIEIIAASQDQYTAAQRAEAYSGRGWVAIVQEGCESAMGYFEQGQELDSELTSLSQGLRQCDSLQERGTEIFN